MPRNSSGVYTLPVAAFAPSGLIKSDDHNNNYDDIATALSQSLATTGVSTMTGPIKAWAGSAAAPSYVFSGGATTGFYLAGANQIGWAAAGVVAATFNADKTVTWHGAQSFPSLSATGDISAGTTLTATGAAALNGGAAVAGTLTVTTTSSLDGMATLSAGMKMAEIAEPASPAATYVNIYAKTGDILVIQDSDGYEQTLGLSLAGASDLVVTNNAGTPTTQIDVTATRAILTNSYGVGASESSISITINLGAAGANGLDAGAIAASTWYHLYLIYNKTAVAGLASTSATSPALPAGYTYSMYIGAMVTNSSSQLYRTLQKGKKTIYKVVAGSTTTKLRQICGGAIGSTTVPTYVEEFVSSYIPSTAVTGLFSSWVGSVSNRMMIAPNGDYGAYDDVYLTGTPPWGQFPTASSNSYLITPFEMLLETSSVFVASTTSTALFAQGWTNPVNAT